MQRVVSFKCSLSVPFSSPFVQLNHFQRSVRFLSLPSQSPSTSVIHSTFDSFLKIFFICNARNLPLSLFLFPFFSFQTSSSVNKWENAFISSCSFLQYKRVVRKLGKLRSYRLLWKGTGLAKSNHTNFKELGSLRQNGST